MTIIYIYHFFNTVKFCVKIGNGKKDIEYLSKLVRLVSDNALRRYKTQKKISDAPFSTHNSFVFILTLPTQKYIPYIHSGKFWYSNSRSLLYYHTTNFAIKLQLK